MWPRDLLVPQFRNARIATYSYESDWRDRRVNTSLPECGRQLLEVLLQHRQDASVRRCANPGPGALSLKPMPSQEGQRPLILIGHSLGGLIIQQVCYILANELGITH